jgi:hypothetical protein
VSVFISGCGKQSDGRSDVFRTPSYSAKGWAPGHWVRYEYSVGGVKPAAVTVAVTGSERSDGCDLFWLEVLYETGGYGRATRILTPELAASDFFRAEGDVPTGAVEVRRRNGDSTPYEVPLDDAAGTSVASLQSLFGGGPGSVLTESKAGVEYEALSGKDLVCTEYGLSVNGFEVGTVYASGEVPVTGVTRSVHGSAVLELVDFGLSGAGSAF